MSKSPVLDSMGYARVIIGQQCVTPTLVKILVLSWTELYFHWPNIASILTCICFSSVHNACNSAFSSGLDLCCTYLLFLHFRLVLFHSEYGLLDVLDHLYAELEMIRKFAQLEFRHGSVERGKTLFENLVTTYPRRTDIWSVYIDVCIKFGDFDQARWHFVPDFTSENLCVKTLLQMHHSWELGEIWETRVPGIEK